MAKADWSDLLAQLEALGFYTYCAPDEIAQAKTSALETGWLFDDCTQRSYFADAEDLA